MVKFLRRGLIHIVVLRRVINAGHAVQKTWLEHLQQDIGGDLQLQHKVWILAQYMDYILLQAAGAVYIPKSIPARGSTAAQSTSISRRMIILSCLIVPPRYGTAEIIISLLPATTGFLMGINAPTTCQMTVPTDFTPPRFKSKPSKACRKASRLLRMHSQDSLPGNFSKSAFQIACGHREREPQLLIVVSGIIEIFGVDPKAPDFLSHVAHLSLSRQLRQNPAALPYFLFGMITGIQFRFWQ